MAATGLEIAGAVTTIVQLVDFTCKVFNRVDDFQSHTRELPKTFRQFSLELPLLQETLQQITEATSNGRISDETQRALIPTIEGCREQIESLNAILAKTLPRPEDSWGEKSRKAIISLQKDSKVGKIMNSIRGYLGTLTFYFVASSTPLRPLTGTSIQRSIWKGF